MAARLTSAFHPASAIFRSTLVAVALAAGYSSNVLGQVRLPEAFLEELGDGGLVFKESLFRGFTLAPIKSNAHMNYELAVRLVNPPIEVRYAIRRYDPSPKAPGVKPDAMVEPTYTATLWNIAEWTKGPGKRGEPKIFNSQAYPTESVRNDFRATWGSSAFLVPEREFAGGFDRCMVSYISKGRTAAFAFYLFNEKDSAAALNVIENIFYALQFR